MEIDIHYQRARALATEGARQVCYADHKRKFEGYREANSEGILSTHPAFCS